MLSATIGRVPKFALFVALALTFIIVIHISSFPSLSKWKLPVLGGQQPQITTATEDASQESPQKASQEPSPDLSAIPCQSLKGGEDVLVVMRTGATEIKDKLPAHLNTTFQCYPHLVIFSDFAEDFHGREVHDVLRDIPDEIKSKNDDFKHYLHVQEAGRQNLNDDELSGKISAESGPVGKSDNAGWRLDKWKFLPMINRTLEMYPDKKWYVFVEPDTYLVWSNLLQWLPKLKPDKPLYYGSEVMIGDDVFAHGGSAFVMSKPAMEKGAEIYNEKVNELHDFTAGHWAGDCVLGKALHDAGVDLTWSWPQFQGGNPSFSMGWTDHKTDHVLWCTPAISYHHLTPYEVRDFWQFEQTWIRSVLAKQKHNRERGLPFRFWGDDMTNVLHHRDTFKLYVMPNITQERNHWNNTPEVPAPDTQGITLEDCRERCEENDDCLQYALGPDGCSTGREPRMGQEDETTTAGWMPERIEEWVKDLDHCWNKDGWAVT
ncbi:glycosyltransferase family 31 protein [Zasmidium cellare ATCC 36951]|uniref:Glycosyltransferase family 31 protein n=1 Tax=Zasmidium cellare ATCC 36951 TaxID=1080233 RepID=A0A6A6CZI7_ZASCE|nr:glycosyltransferase family 31 protein [Zasmidium cellare ATCC 36951]KAF2172564.1 glycosyltransferase family 31 protein [Zasmidium cellare ATCC 36951]